MLFSSMLSLNLNSINIIVGADLNSLKCIILLFTDWEEAMSNSGYHIKKTNIILTYNKI